MLLGFRILLCLLCLLHLHHNPLTKPNLIMEDLKSAFLDDPFPILIDQQEPAFPKLASSTTAEVAVEAPQVQEEISDIDAFLSDSDSLKSLVIQDGPPVIKPRPYQKEMLEESLRRNVIVAVSNCGREWRRLRGVSAEFE